MEEIWRDVKGYEGLYQVSNLGRVKSLERFKKTRKNKNGRNGYIHMQESIRIPTKDYKGYLRLTLCKEGKQKPFRVHRLVAQAFIPNPNNLPQVNHKDENKENNFVYINEDGTADLEKSNLEWCTNEYNHNYGTRNKRSAEKHIGRKIPFEQIKNKIAVLQINKDTNEVIRKYDSIKEAQICCGVKTHYSHIGACCKGERKTAYGFKWRYAN